MITIVTDNDGDDTTGNDDDVDGNSVTDDDIDDNDCNRAMDGDYDNDDDGAMDGDYDDGNDDDVDGNGTMDENDEDNGDNCNGRQCQQQRRQHRGRLQWARTLMTPDNTMATTTMTTRSTMQLYEEPRGRQSCPLSRQGTG
jgi:hypothetical protein